MVERSIPVAACARFEQLDTLRAFAVISVVACHTMPSTSFWASYGSHGVKLFLVLSGFLITGILLDARTEIARSGSSYGHALRAFYARRLLRIFPIYYLTLAAAVLIRVPGLKDNWPFYVSYLSNWKIAFDGFWHPAAHLWSLAVEEQFYIFWPFVVLFTPRRLLPPIVGAMVLLAPVLRVTLIATTHLWAPGVHLLTPATFDSLGLGSLLAIGWRSDWRTDRIVNQSMLVALPVFIFEQLVLRRAPVWAALEVSWPFLCVWCVHRASRGVSGPIGRLLSFPPLRLLGTVSYGVYLFHVFVRWVGWGIARHTGMKFALQDPGTANVVFVLLVSTFAAVVSYTLVERPLNRLKVCFPYHRALEPEPARRPQLSPTSLQVNAKRSRATPSREASPATEA